MKEQENRKQKIVFITNSIGFAGAEKMLVFVANQLSQRKNHCCIINLNTVDECINEKTQEIDNGVTVYTLPKQKARSKNKAVLRFIENTVREFKADVIIGFTSKPNMYAKIIGAKLHIPSIMSERGDPSRKRNVDSLKDVYVRIKGKIMKFIVNRSSGGVFQTDGAMAYYGKGLQKRGVVIPNPIFIKGDVPEIPFEDREKTVVAVGRLDNEQKRYDIMLKAFKLFSGKHPEYILKLYGRGVDEEKIEKWIEKLKLEEKVKLMGLSENPMQDIAKDGIFFISSDYEGISNSLLEAMAVGLPCVSTDHTPGGARLLITNRKNGLLAPVEDIKALSDALCEFAENPDLAKQCGENAKDVINRFEPERIIDMWEGYIQKLCER